jgi:hypothetical protein
MTAEKWDGVNGTAEPKECTSRFECSRGWAVGSLPAGPVYPAFPGLAPNGVDLRVFRRFHSRNRCGCGDAFGAAGTW